MSQIPALFNPSSHSNYKIDATHANNRSEEPVLNIIEDAYQIEFYKKGILSSQQWLLVFHTPDHANFICKDATRGNSIYSILKPAKNSTDFKNNALRTSETVRVRNDCDAFSLARAMNWSTSRYRSHRCYSKRVWQWSKLSTREPRYIL